MPKGYPNPKSDAEVFKAVINGDEFGPLPTAPVEADGGPGSGLVAAIAKNAAIRQPDDELATVRAELAALKAKMERKTEIAEVVTEAMMDERRKNFGKITPPEKFVMPQPNGERLIKMALDRHYKPVGFYEVVGYNKEEVVKKRSDGTTIVTERAEFIPDIVKPYPISGVGFQNKIWAGTVLKVQETESKQMRADRIASYELG